MNENLIEFNYILSSGMLQISNQVPGLGNRVHCYMPVEHQKHLILTSLYLVAEHSCSQDNSGKDVHSFYNPLGIVAMRETEAVMIYKSIRPDCKDASVYCELVRNCDNMEVEE